MSKIPEWAVKEAQAVQDAVIAESEAERYLYMLPTGRGKEAMDRHLSRAISEAYTRGQRDNAKLPKPIRTLQDEEGK